MNPIFVNQIQNEIIPSAAANCIEWKNSEGVCVKDFPKYNKNFLWW